jgi:hypothetical protein
MKSSNQPSEEAAHGGVPQPFANFSTMPGGWDLSGQPSRRSEGRALPTIASTPQNDAPAEAASGEASGQAQKFTQPRTIPTGWDTSALK